MKIPIKLLAGSACVLLACAGCSSSKSAAKDVSVTACQTSPTGGHPTARGRIVNHTSKASIYTIHVKFVDASGNSVGDGLAAVAKVDSGKTALWHANGTFSAKGKLKCELASVTRHLSP